MRAEKERAYIIRNPIYAYAFDMIAELERSEKLLPVLWFTDADVYFYQLHRLPFADRWHDRVYFYGEAELPAFIEAVKQRFDICLVLPWEEAAVLSAAALMEAFGLKHPDPKLLRLFRDKFALKEYLKQNDPHLPLHTHFLVSSADDFFAKRERWPDRFVLKPIDGVANCANGFFARDTPKEDLVAFFAQSPSQKFILEQFLDGVEYAVNGQIDAAGTITVIAVVRYERKAANGRPNLYFRDWLESSRSAAFAKLADYAKRVMRATALRSSPFHMELMLCQDQVYLIEVGARLAGGHLIYATDWAHGPGFSSIALALQNYLQKPSSEQVPLRWDLYDQSQHVLVTGISAVTGPLLRLEGRDEVEAMPEFLLWFKRPGVGDRLRVTIDGETTPYAVHLVSRDPHVSMLDLSEQVLTKLRWQSSSHGFILVAWQIYALLDKALRKLKVLCWKQLFRLKTRKCSQE